MIKLISIVAVSLFAIGASAQDSTKAQDRVKDQINQVRGEWADKVAGELADLPKDIQQKCQDAKDRADALGRQIQALKVDSMSREELQAKIKELIATKKLDADARIKVAMEKIDEFKTAHKAEIEAAQADVKVRIEAKKTELAAKRAEIEKKIAEKKAEIEAAAETEPVAE